MRIEIVERLNLIVRNDTNLRYNGEPIFSVFENTYPPSLEDTKLPCVIWLPRQDSGYIRTGSYNYKTVVEYDGRIYYDLLASGLTTIQNIRVSKFPELFANAFLSRPHLDYGDEGLSGVTGEITFRTTHDLAVALAYPIGGKPMYWGNIIRLTIPYEIEIMLAT